MSHCGVRARLTLNDVRVDVGGAQGAKGDLLFTCFIVKLSYLSTTLNLAYWTTNLRHRQCQLQNCSTSKHTSCRCPCVSLYCVLRFYFDNWLENLLVQLRDPMAFNKPTDVVHGSDALSILVSMQTVAPWSTVCAELR
jgi:hypothetical protein